MSKRFRKSLELYVFSELLMEICICCDETRLNKINLHTTAAICPEA